MKPLKLVVAWLGAVLFLPVAAQAEVRPDAPKGINATEVHAEAYGAKGDGVTDTTAMLQAAIDATAARHGTMVLKPGIYLTGSLFLKSGMALRLDKGVRLVGVQTLEGYPRMPTRIAGIETTWPSALINVYEQTDVKVYGEGTIDGNGKVFWESFFKLKKDYEAKGLRWAADYDAQRPRLIQIFNSSRVVIGSEKPVDERNAGLMLIRSGFWTVQVVYSHAVKVSGVTIRNNIDGRGPSTDGVDLDSSHDVLVENADIDVNDDALCLKAGRDADGLRVNRPTERVLIRNVVVRAAAAGVTFGSETSGGIRDVEASGIKVVGPAGNGIILKSAHTRGGTVSNIYIHDMDVQNVKIGINIDLNWNPAYSYAKIPEGIDPVPAIWKVLATPVPLEKGLPHFRDFKIENIKVTGAQTALNIAAYPNAPLENFQFDNIDIAAGTAGSINHARNIRFVRTKVAAEDGKPVVVTNVVDVTGLP